MQTNAEVETVPNGTSSIQHATSSNANAIDDVHCASLDSSSTQPPTTRLDSLNASVSDATSTLASDMRIIGNWGNLVDDDVDPITQGIVAKGVGVEAEGSIPRNSLNVSGSVDASNPVVASDMRLLRKLWGEGSDDVGDPTATDTQVTGGRNDNLEPVVSKTQKTRLKQK